MSDIFSPYNWYEIHWRFGPTHCLRLQGRKRNSKVRSVTVYPSLHSLTFWEILLANWGVSCHLIWRSKSLWEHRKRPQTAQAHSSPLRLWTEEHRIGPARLKIELVLAAKDEMTLHWEFTKDSERFGVQPAEGAFFMHECCTDDLFCGCRLLRLRTWKSSLCFGGICFVCPY